MAKRMGATTYELDSSHVPMLSHPDVVINVIRDAVKSGFKALPQQRKCLGNKAISSEIAFSAFSASRSA